MKKHLFRFLLRLALTAVLLLVLSRGFPTIFSIGNGWAGLVVVAAILAALNTVIYPIIKILTLPLRLIGGVVISMLINIGLLWVTLGILQSVGPNVATLIISGGILTWIFAAMLLGLTHLIP